MRWLLRTLLVLAVLCLTALAILPYTASLRQGWQDFQKAWTTTRSGEPPKQANTPAAPADANTPERTRTLSKPSTSEEAVPLEATTVNDDPLLTEARRRARENPEAAMQWLQAEATGPDRLRGMLEIVALWAAEDSESALLWLESNAQGIARLETLNSGITLWSQQDPDAAAAWIDGMANDGSKETAAKALATNWASHAPEDAAAWVNALPRGTIKDEAAAALIESWGATDPESATVWALQEATLYGNKELLTQSIRQYTTADPTATEAFLREMAKSSTASAPIQAYVQTLAQQDPNAAADWLTNLPKSDPLYKADHNRTLLQEWSRSDSVAASAWLNEKPLGPERDAAIQGFSSTMQAFEPEAVAAWSNTISNPELRVESLQSSIQKWAHTQPHQALDWVKSADLEPDLRHALASEIGAD